ncbi:signal recognition particle 14kD protein-domain-containing protein [Amylocarpus encephaloides]|uniref:Signal recognition particle subunit SRP14 n=1 Tax=Amylocarpus encephaloides TaxID=45428 RepID=A0A9P7YD29_9HELO|nr:signal recognition particle 14kD protein-domain-containing protein [Amylocarpus encephaloides]
MSKHLNNDDFFHKLSDLFESTTHSSIYLTQKRMTYGAEVPNPGSDTKFPDATLPEPTSIVIRASNGENKQGRKEGKKVKLSTIVEADALAGFFAKYADVCKSRMSGLKKRDRSKAKEKLKAKKKKLGAGEVK